MSTDCECLGTGLPRTVLENSLRIIRHLGATPKNVELVIITARATCPARCKKCQRSRGERPGGSA